VETRSIDHIKLYYKSGEHQAADLVAQACQQSIKLIRESWGLDLPEDCRVYVMISLKQIVFHAAPWNWRLLLFLSFPFWYPREKRIWGAVGGYAQRFGARQVIFIKPPRLIQAGDRVPGARLFCQEMDVEDKVRQVVAHELTHASTSGLKLPNWLNEGLAMVTVDRIAGKSTVKNESLTLLVKYSKLSVTDIEKEARNRDVEALLYEYARGYWMTRYLEETCPGFLKDLLSRRPSSDEVLAETAAAFGVDRGALMGYVGDLLFAYFTDSMDK